MKQRNRFLPVAVVAFLATASTALAAPNMYTSPAFVGSSHNATCKFLNVHKSEVTVTIEAVDASADIVLATSGETAVASGGYLQISSFGPNTRVYCRFLGAKSKKSRAALTVYNNSIDSTDLVVVPAN